MSNRANSSARNRRAGPSTNIQETLTANPQTINSSNTFSTKEEPHKLLSITQAFMLINGKIRNLENQVEHLKKYNNTSESINTQNAIRPDDDFSDVSEFKPSSNIEDDFYQNNENNMNSDSISMPNQNNQNNQNNENNEIIMQQNVLDINKTREIAESVTIDAVKKYDKSIEDLEDGSKIIKNQFLQINEKTENLTSKLNSIESLITNIQELNTKLPDMMKSVEERFNTLQSDSKSTRDKVDNVLLKYNEKLDSVQDRMSNVQDYAISLHSLFVKRFDEHIDNNFETKIKEELEEMKEKQVEFNLNNNETTTIENCLEENDDEEDELADSGI